MSRAACLIQIFSSALSKKIVHAQLNEQVCLPDQLQQGDDGVGQEGKPENQINLLVHNIHWQGAHSRRLGDRGCHSKCVHRAHDDSREHLCDLLKEHV